LQKLTSSAWPARPWVKNLRIRRWSSLDVRKHSRGERALEAGSPVAKPRARWRAPSGALVDGRHFGPGKSHLIDAGANGKALATSPGFGLRIQRSGTGSARGKIEQPCTRLKTPRQGGIARCGARPFPFGQGCGRFRRSWTHAVKRVSTWGSVSVRKQNAVRSL
jgi:hypothetical protein